MTSEQPEEGPSLSPEVMQAIFSFFQDKTFLIIDYSKGFVNPFGTGVFVEINNLPYAITAYHVWEQGIGYGDFKIAAFSLLDAKVGDIKKVWWSPSKENIIELKYVNGVEVDLLAIKLDPSLLKRYPKLFIDEAMLDVAHKLDHNNFYQVAGFPTKLYRQSAQNSIRNPNAVTLMVYGTSMRESTNWDTKYSSSYHLVLDYPKEMARVNDSNILAPELGGLSGGGIWQIFETGTEIWAIPKKVKLVGIQFEWDWRSRFMAGSQIKYIVGAIKQQA